MRFAGYALILPTTAAGIALLLAVIVGRWVPYLVYRLGERRWVGATKMLVLWLFVLALPFVLAVPGGRAWPWQIAAILAWLAFRARRELRTYVSAWRPL